MLWMWGREIKAPVDMSSITGNNNGAETVRREKSLGF